MEDIQLFPCKSINLLRFIERSGKKSIYKYIDAEDGRNCWLFLKTDELIKLLEEWAKNKPK